MNGWIIGGGTDPVPIRNHAIDPGKFHLEKMTFERIRIGGIIEANQRVEMRPDIWQAARSSPFGMMARIVTFPMVTPATPDSWRLVPGHVVHHANLLLGSGTGGWNTLPPPRKQRQSGDNNKQHAHIDPLSTEPTRLKIPLPDTFLFGALKKSRRHRLLCEIRTAHRPF